MKEKTWEEYPDYESSFVSRPENFLQSVRGLPYFDQGYFQFHRRDLVTNEEIIYENHPFVHRFKDAKILIVAAGPSTRDLEWSPEGYDLICSCNHFYYHDRVRPLVDFATMNDEIYLLDRNLEGLKTTFCFENANRNVSYFYNKFFPQCMLAHTRYLSKIGSGPRLLAMATLWGAKEIHFIGIDGHFKGKPYNSLCNHTFEPAKPITGTYSYELYERQYYELWDYLRHRIGKDVQYVNLGFGHDHNISSLMLDNHGNWLF